MRARRWWRRRASEELASALAGVFIRAGVVCEESNDPIGVELSGVAKNAAALASGATEGQGLNAAGAAAGHIFAEVWRWAEAQGARPESMIGLAGTGDLVATALAPESRNRRAGELLAQGVSARRDPGPAGAGGRGAGDGAAARPGADRRGGRVAGHHRAGAADQRRAAARGMGRRRAHDAPAPSPLAPRRATRRLGALARAPASDLPPPASELEPARRSTPASRLGGAGAIGCIRAQRRFDENGQASATESLRDLYWR